MAEGVNMAALRVTVCLAAPADLRPALDAAMAPFEAGRGHARERSIWDSWTIRGGSDDFGFVIAGGAADDPRLIHDDPYHTGEKPPSEPGMCAGGPVALLDLARPYALATHEAESSWDLWHELARSLPAPRPLKELVAEHDTYATAIELYRQQPLIRAFRERCGDVPVAYRLSGLYRDAVPDLGRGRDDFVHRQVAENARQTDLLTVDGWWINADGRAAHRDGDIRASEGPFDVLGYLATLPGDTIVVAVKCHI
jgi:hypothetical protein